MVEESYTKLDELQVFVHQMDYSFIFSLFFQI